jgi:hypothetical protein
MYGNGGEEERMSKGKEGKDDWPQYAHVATFIYRFQSRTHITISLHEPTTAEIER